MNTQHTPGPWEIGRCNPEAPEQLLNIMSHGSGIAVVRHGGHPKAEANARLIAAAPELLHALEAAMPILDAFNRTEGCKSTLALAIAVISKAKGYQ